MKAWMDTEFMEDGKTIELLSIGIVREDGVEYYAVNEDADLSKANDWVKANVLSKLDFTEAKPRDQIRDDIEMFLRADGTKPELWAYYADYDWVAFCQLFGRMVDLPKGFPRYCRDIKQLALEVGDPELPKQQKDEHHALADARWNRQAWQFCHDRKRRATELLAEWLRTPFFETKAEWEAWVREFRPRVEAAVLSASSGNVT